MSVERDLSGTVIAGRYRVERRLGAGGMGAVWRVRHLESLQRYALKTLHATTAGDRMSVERFLREARAAAALSSKHVVKIVDAQMGHVDQATNEPLPFLVMELLTGSNLGQILETNGALAPEELVWVLQQVARALDLAHAKGIVHRDLKPENIFIALDEDGEPITKVCDFGIAKIDSSVDGGLDSRNALGTETGATIGTPLYMAPEQARNSASVVPASDQWAIALIAFRALTTREYFAGASSTADLLLRIVNDPLVLPSTRLSKLPRAFDEWFLRSCERDPTKRWPSVGAQVQALRQALAVTEPRPPGVVPSVEILANAATLPAIEGDTRTRTAIDTTNAPASRSAAISASVAATPALARETARTPTSSRWLLIGLAAIVGISVAIGIGVRAAHRDEGASTTASALPSASAAPTVASATAAPVVSAPIDVTPVASAADLAPKTTAVATAAASIKPKAFASAKASASIAPVASTTSTPSATTTAAPRLPAGAACERNAECASLICAAYQCQ